MRAILPIADGDTANAPQRCRCLQMLALALAVCTSGCIVIPTPEFNSGNARANITAETPAQFEIGKTTRADLALALGEPDAVSADELIWAYRSEKIRGIWCVGGYGSGACAPITKDQYLLTKFNEQGVLQKFESSSRWFTSADSSQMLPSVTERSLTATTNAPLAVRLQKRAFWFKNVDGYKPRGATQLRGLPGQLLLTDTDLQFFADAANDQFANLGPKDANLIVSFDSIHEVNVDKFNFGRRLVVRTKAGVAHSFEIPKGFFQDKEAIQSFSEFIQKKIIH